MTEQKKSPEISIIVPVYKVEKYLNECIDSILAQTFTDFELILVDDGSPDSCPALCDAAAAKDSRIRVIHQKNRGLSGARNAGLDAAEGEWIAFVDSDDTIMPDFCAKLYHAAQEAGAQMAVCNYRQVDEALTPIREQYLHVRREVLTPEQALEHSTLLPYMVVWNKLYHRSIFAQLRFAEGKLNEDTLLIAYAYEKADRIANIPDALYLYRKVAGSIVNSKVTLRQQNRPIELFERQTDELGYFSKKFLPRALLFSIFGKIHQAKTDTAQDTRRLSSGTTGCPSRTICLSCQSYEVHFGIPLGCSSTQNRTTVTLSIVLLRTSASSTFDSLALVIRGVESNSARHKASSKVDLPEPVLPVMAKMPAFFNGSTVKSTSNSPAKEARFFPRIANIFIMNCYLNYSLPASLMTSCNNSFIAAGISCSSYFLL